MLLLSRLSLSLSLYPTEFLLFSPLFSYSFLFFFFFLPSNFFFLLFSSLSPLGIMHHHHHHHHPLSSSCSYPPAHIAQRLFPNGRMRLVLFQNSALHFSKTLNARGKKPTERVAGIVRSIITQAIVRISFQCESLWCWINLVPSSKSFKRYQMRAPLYKYIYTFTCNIVWSIDYVYTYVEWCARYIKLNYKIYSFSLSLLYTYILTHKSSFVRIVKSVTFVNVKESEYSIGKTYRLPIKCTSKRRGYIFFISSPPATRRVLARLYRRSLIIGISCCAAWQSLERKESSSRERERAWKINWLSLAPREFLNNDSYRLSRAHFFQTPAAKEAISKKKKRKKSEFSRIIIRLFSPLWIFFFKI